MMMIGSSVACSGLVMSLVLLVICVVLVFGFDLDLGWGVVLFGVELGLRCRWTSGCDPVFS